MIIDMTQKILMLDDEPITIDDNECLDLRKVCIEALTIHYGNCPTCQRTVNPMSNVEAIAAWDLARKIRDNDKCELTAEEAVRIQNNLANRWAHPGIIAQAHRMLELANDSGRICMRQ